MTIHVLQAIVTKYFGPTNTRGSRIKASAAAGAVFMPYRHELSIEQNHAAAARQLAEKFKWTGRYFQGGMLDGGGYCFVCTAGERLVSDPAFVVELDKAAA